METLRAHKVPGQNYWERLADKTIGRMSFHEKEHEVEHESANMQDASAVLRSAIHICHTYMYLFIQ